MPGPTGPVQQSDTPHLWGFVLLTSMEVLHVVSPVFFVLTKKKWVRIGKFGSSPLRKDELATPQIRMQGILLGVAVIPNLSPVSHLAKLVLG